MYLCPDVLEHYVNLYDLYVIGEDKYSVVVQ